MARAILGNEPAWPVSIRVMPSSSTIACALTRNSWISWTPGSTLGMAASVRPARTIPVVDDRNERLETALRILTKARLASMQVPNFAIGRWCDAWEAEAERRGLEPSADSWEDGIRWIVSKVAAGEQPPG
jgi:hypothetical protein